MHPFTKLTLHQYTCSVCTAVWLMRTHIPHVASEWQVFDWLVALLVKRKTLWWHTQVHTDPLCCGKYSASGHTKLTEWELLWSALSLPVCVFFCSAPSARESGQGVYLAEGWGDLCKYYFYFSTPLVQLDFHTGWKDFCLVGSGVHANQTKRTNGLNVKYIWLHWQFSWYWLHSKDAA